MHPIAVLRSIIVLALALPLGGAIAAAQDASSPSDTLIVTGFGQASAPAETATVQFGVGMEIYGPPTPPDPQATPGAKERSQVEPVFRSLADAGVPDDAISVILSPFLSDVYLPIGGPALGLFRIELDTADPARITEIVNAAVVGAAQERLIVGQVSVSYGVADCAGLQRAAREAAIADGRDRAAMEAELLDVTLGELRGAEDVTWSVESMVAAYGAASPVACGPYDAGSGAFQPYPPAPAFDPGAEPMVTVFAQMKMTFSIESRTAATPAA